MTTPYPYGLDLTKPMDRGAANMVRAYKMQPKRWARDIIVTGATDPSVRGMYGSLFGELRCLNLEATLAAISMHIDRHRRELLLLRERGPMFISQFGTRHGIRLERFMAIQIVARWCRRRYPDALATLVESATSAWDQHLPDRRPRSLTMVVGGQEHTINRATNI